jgi:hypothetical protein
MKVFLSWSGERSHCVASLLGEWLVCVIQAVQPWISSRDIDRGSLWFGEIGDQLKDTSVGIICLTRENRLRPWILFEAGALAKGLATTRVCTLLIDLENKEVEDPLAQFNHTIPDKSGIFGLVRTLNFTLGERALGDKTLDQVFETYWPQFEKKFDAIIADTNNMPAAEPRPDSDVLAEILDNTRSIGTRVRKLEEQTEIEEANPWRDALRAAAADSATDMTLAEFGKYLQRSKNSLTLATEVRHLCALSRS